MQTMCGGRASHVAFASEPTRRGLGGKFMRRARFVLRLYVCCARMQCSGMRGVAILVGIYSHSATMHPRKNSL